MRVEDLAALFKQHFTFAIALNAAQKCVSTSPTGRFVDSFCSI